MHIFPHTQYVPVQDVKKDAVTKKFVTMTK